jgi:hypothetical protein
MSEIPQRTNEIPCPRETCREKLSVIGGQRGKAGFIPVEISLPWPFN